MPGIVFLYFAFELPSCGPPLHPPSILGLVSRSTSEHDGFLPFLISIKADLASPFTSHSVYFHTYEGVPASLGQSTDSSCLSPVLQVCP
ncbi:hypothetical protein M426DRAFT_110081 [Hypoxylon sp. CI-4A]|nr:hypothetical protein M426DRAFT_110081 [Hypoxylon sp. CI-4A]